MGSIVIAGTTSSVGKTTVAIGIIDAFSRRGISVQPFKVGPDYIDPGHHTLLADKGSRPSRNLDSWMMSPPALLDLYHRAMAGADVGVVEGVMGLFDGYSGGDETGSTAQVAKLLNTPVLLVIDVSHTARSAAAVALGFREFDPRVQLAGVVLNYVGSAGHLATVTDAVRSALDLPILGFLHRDAQLELPQRHLGLVPAAEARPDEVFRKRLAREVDANFDIEAIRSLALGQNAPPARDSGLFPPHPEAARTAIAVARDEAFSFYYQDNLDLLSAWGAKTIAFSPLRDHALPPRVSGLYIGGGFPEMWAEQLSGNESMLNDIRAAARNGMPLYVECGGLMYLTQAIVDFTGNRHAMAGVLPGETTIVHGQLSLGYAEVQALKRNPLMERGEKARGHEFHYSRWSTEPDEGDAAYSVINKGGRLAGFSSGDLLASYIHLHFASSALLAPRFMRSCERFQSGHGGG